MTEYEAKLCRERQWHEHRGFRPGHILNSWPFCSPHRAAVNGHFLSTQFAGQIRAVLERDHLENPRMLIAPTGPGNALRYLLPLSERIAGIDISPAVIEAATSRSIRQYQGDIKDMNMFEACRFDLVVMADFFHHYVKFGFGEFLQEVRRVLRPGGHLFALEPNILHPFSLAAWCGKKVFGNITGSVEDESPFYPGRLTSAMRRCGFQGVRLSAATYSHHRVPIPLARILHGVTPLLRRAPLVKYFAAECVFYGRKP